MPSPLQSPQLRRILIAYTVNRLGTWLGLVALMVAVFDHTHSALAVAVVLVAGQVLPALAVPALVARVEASRRRGELSGLYVFEGVATASLAVLIWNFSLPAVVLLVALDGTAALAASALLRTEIARVAREHAQAVHAPAPGGQAPEDSEAQADSDAQADSAARADSGAQADSAARARSEAQADAVEQAERRANAALNVAFSATFVLGPVLGGIVVAASGAPQALLIDVVSFLICGALLSDLRPHVEAAAEESIRARLRAAWRHINDTPSLRRLLLAEAAAFVFFESAAPIEITYAKTTLHAGDRGFGLLLTAWGAGTVIGSVVFARSLRRPLGYLLSAGTLCVGLAYMGFSAAPSLAVAGIAAFVGGAGNGMELPSLFSIVQRITPKQLHGQMMGAVESLGALCPAIGLPLGGALVALGSPRSAFLLVGAGTAATALLLLLIAGPGRVPAVTDAEASRLGEDADPLGAPAALPAEGTPRPAHTS